MWPCCSQQGLVGFAASALGARGPDPAGDSRTTLVRPVAAFGELNDALVFMGLKMEVFMKSKVKAYWECLGSGRR